MPSLTTRVCVMISQSVGFGSMGSTGAIVSVSEVGRLGAQRTAHNRAMNKTSASFFKAVSLFNCLGFRGDYFF